MRFQLRQQTCLQGCSFAGRASWDGFGLEVTSLTALLEIPLDRGHRDREGRDDVSTRHAAIDGTQHALAKVLRIGFHALLLSCAAQLTYSFPLSYHLAQDFCKPL
jgi:hypothetical protein